VILLAPRPAALTPCYTGTITAGWAGGAPEITSLNLDLNWAQYILLP